MSERAPVGTLQPAGVVDARGGTPGSSRADDPSNGSVPVAAQDRPRDDADAYTLPPDARPVVAEIRARPGTLVVGATAAGSRWTVRVEVPEVWDVVRLDVPMAAPVRDVKRAALAELLSETAVVDEYVVKLNGAAILDEGASLAAVGALDGSIFLVTHRRRRAVRS